MTDKAIGSVHYISPEQARGDTTDAKADIYSVGIMMYEMLSGKLPFDSDSPVSVAIKQISDTPTPLRQLNAAVPEALEAITNRAMAKDPRDRYPSARAMLADLEEFKRNPSVKFEYQYLNDPEPTRYVDKVVSKTTSKQPARTPNRRKAPAKKAGFVSALSGSGNWRMALPILAGVAAAFAIGAIILVIVIFKSAPNQLFTRYNDCLLYTSIPRYGAINLHVSLLPKYRGAAPVQWAVIHGEKETGVTIMQLDEGLDTGDILFVQKVAIPEDMTSGELFEEVSGAGAALLCTAIRRIAAGEVAPVPQQHDQATLAPPLSKEMALFHFAQPAQQLQDVYKRQI